MNANGTFDKLARRIEQYRDEMVDLQMKLCAIPAIAPSSGGEGEAKKAEFLVEWLKANGFVDISVVKAPDLDAPAGYRPNILAYYRGKSHARTVWVMTHMDVVPPGEVSLWRGDPFKAWVEKGRVYGRGVEDNQQDMVASLFAVKALRAEGIVPAYDIGIALVADEETGSMKGIEHVLKSHKCFRKQDLIIVPDAGDEHGTMIEVAEKTPPLAQVQDARQAGPRLDARERHQQLQGGQLLHRRPERSLQDLPGPGPALRSAHLHLRADEKRGQRPQRQHHPRRGRLLHGHEDPAEGQGPGRPEARSGRSRRGSKRSSRSRSTPRSSRRPRPRPRRPSQAPVVLALKKAVQAVYKKDAKAMGIGGGTVAAVFRRAGFPAACWSKLDETAHQPNEYCIIDNMVGDAKVFGHIFLQE